MATTRQSNLDLLRILAFLMVVTIHISTTGVKFLPITELNWFIATLLEALTRPAVHIFILLGGYFLGSRPVTPQQALKRTSALITPMALFALTHYFSFVRPLSFTSFGAFLMTFITGKLHFPGTEWYGHLWFMYPYAALMIISPILNSAIVTLEKKQFQKMLLVLGIIFLALPSVNLTLGHKVVYTISGPLPYFITSYLTGGYLKRFGCALSRPKLFLLFFGTTLWTWGGTIIHAHLWHPPKHKLLLGKLGSYDNFFVNEQWAVFVGAVALFVLFMQVKISYKPLLAKLGQAAFFAYTIHMLIMFRFYDVIGYKNDLTELSYIVITTGIILGVAILSLGYGVTANAIIAKVSKKRNSP